MLIRTYYNERTIIGGNNCVDYIDNDYNNMIKNKIYYEYNYNEYCSDLNDVIINFD